MGHSSKPPAPPPTPDPTAMVNAQTHANQLTQEGNLVSQVNPFGSQTYTSEIDPVTGVPRYTATTKYSEAQQHLLDNLLGYQTTASGTAKSLLDDAATKYTTSPDFSSETQGLTGKLLGQYTAYLNPQFDYQTKQLDTKLRTQGIGPESPAYKQQMMDLKDTQNRSVTGFLAQIEPQAFDQAVKSYQLPYQTAQSLMGMGSPSTLNFSNLNTNMTAPNVNQAYGVQQQAYGNQIAYTNASNQANANNISAWASPIASIGGSILGGPIGGAIGGSLANGLFGGGGGGMPSAQSWGNGTSVIPAV